MRRNITSLAYSAILLVAAALASDSCKREPIHEPFSNYYLVLEGDYKDLHIDPAVPSMYEAVFYDPVTHNEVGQSYLGTNGGYIYDLPAGTYEMIVYSLNSGTTKITGLKRYLDGHAYTDRYTESDTLSYYSPDHLMVARDPQFEIPFLYDRDDVEYIYAYPKSIAKSWCVVIDGIKNLTNAAAIDIYITGQSSSKVLSTEELSDNVNTIHFSGKIDKEKNVIYTPFCTFGKLAGKHSTLRLAIKDPNNRTIVCHADVTDQFEDPQNTDRYIRAHFEIEIDPKKDGGMMPDVEEWGENVYYYDIM